MAQALSLALDLIARFEGLPSAAETGRAFFETLQPLGVKAVYARSYRDTNPLSSVEELTRGQQVLARISPPGWEEAYARGGLDRNNPIIAGTRARLGSFAWSDIPSRKLGTWNGWLALDDFDIEDGIAVPCHGLNGYRAAISLGFEKIVLNPAERRAVELISVVVHDRLRALMPAMVPTGDPLTRRERDCLAFVADGKSDWEISVIMNIAQSTAHAHVENAKRKLGARTRAQAVARLIRRGGV